MVNFRPVAVDAFCAADELSHDVVDVAELSDEPAEYDCDEETDDDGE